MPKTSGSKDKRARIDLELFVLALVRLGIATPYDLKISASISPGASVPVLNRLEARGYLRKGEGGPRNRQEFEITPKGESFLENSWRGLFQSAPSTDLEAVLRIAALALILGEPKRSVADYLSQASAARKAATTEKTGRATGRTTPSEVYLWMRRVAVAGRSQSDAALLRKLATAVRRLR